MRLLRLFGFFSLFGFILYTNYTLWANPKIIKNFVDTAYKRTIGELYD